MKEPITILEENKCHLLVKKEFFEAEAIFAAAQKFTDKCTVLIDSLDASSIDVYFENKNPSITQDLKVYCSRILQ